MEAKNNRKMNKASLTTIKKSKNNKTSLIDKFNSLGKHKWVNLETMEKNKPHLLSNVKKCSTKFGERVMVQLDGEIQLYLPERYNSFTDRQLAELGNGNFALINHGMSGKIYRLEILKIEDLQAMVQPTGTSTEQQAQDILESQDPHDNKEKDDDEEEEEDEEVGQPLKMNYYYNRSPESQMW